MRLLFFKESMAWPRSKGHDVHGFGMMQALARLGHEVSLVTLAKPAPEAVAGLPLASLRSVRELAAETNGHPEVVLGRFQERFRSYWGIEPAAIRAVGRMALECRADAVVAVGLSVLPYLGAVQNALRVWYAADEWAWHHFSQLRLADKSTWSNLSQGLTKGLYERAFGSMLDRVWVVSNADRRAMRWVAGSRTIDVIANGVDAEHFQPLEQEEITQSCVFWGRLDFGPNVQGLEWFCRRVWPEILRHFPQARFSIYGFHPTPPVQALSSQRGISLVGDLPDLRPEIARHQVVVLPFVSGGGIKNKLLEAAGMGKAIVCTAKACGGLRGEGTTPLLIASRARDWVRALQDLWANDERRRQLGSEARAWVLRCHTWEAGARIAAAGIESSLRKSRNP